MKYEKGISMIILMIAVMIIIFMVGTISYNGIDAYNISKIQELKDRTKTVKEYVEIYAHENAGMLPVVGSPLNINSITADVNLNLALKAEISKTEDIINTKFYLVDINKLDIIDKTQGNGKNAIDYYLISDITYNVFYIKGLKIGNSVYFR